MTSKPPFRENDSDSRDFKMPTHKNLHQDLLHLAGRELDCSDATYFTREQAENIMRHINKWLETKLGSNDHIKSHCIVDPLYGEETSGDDFRTITWIFGWGDIDSDTIQSAGKSVEFAGPTSRSPEWHILPDAKIDIVTNVERSPIGLEGVEMDALADVRQMPMADSSVGSVHISALNGAPREFEEDYLPGLRDDALHEAVRVLRPGGYLVWDGGTQQDYDLIEKLGLKPIKLIVETHIYEDLKRGKSDSYLSPDLGFDGIFQKPG